MGVANGMKGGYTVQVWTSDVREILLQFLSCLY